MGFFDVIKNIGKAAVGFIPGIGPIASAGLNALDSALTGTGPEGALSIQDQINLQRDQAKARELAGEARKKSDRAVQVQEDLYAADAPLREGYRAGAMNFFDPTNPFARSSGQLVGGGPSLGFDPNSKFMQSIGLSPAPSPGFAPSSGLGGSGGVPEVSPDATGRPAGGVFGGLLERLTSQLGQPMGTPGFNPNAASPGFVPNTAQPGSFANLLESRFGGQERGSGTDFITPSRRASGVKRAV
jgi:hypothetical protein